MEKIVGIKTKVGNLEGRDAIYLDNIHWPNERTLILKGEFNTEILEEEYNTDKGFKPYEIQFSCILFTSSIELDFDNRNFMESFGIIENSEKLFEFRERDHSRKMNENHQHYYFQTYDTVFEIVADGYELRLD